MAHFRFQLLGGYKGKWVFVAKRWKEMRKVRLIRPSRKLRCWDRTNSRKFNDSPRIQRNVAILTHHRNFPANLTNHCHLPQLSPFRGYTKGGNSALQTLAEFWEWLHQTWKRKAAHVLREFRNRSGFNFYNFLQGVRGPFLHRVW